MKRLNDKGFSLIELLIAVTILAFGLLAVAGLQATAIKGNSHGNTISQATSLAEDRIEEIRNMDYADIYNPNPPTTDPNPYIESNVNGTIYSRETLVEVNTPMTDLKRITVTVNWLSKGSHQVVLRTIVADGGG